MFDERLSDEEIEKLIKEWFPGLTEEYYNNVFNFLRHVPSESLSSNETLEQSEVVLMSLGNSTWETKDIINTKNLTALFNAITSFNFSTSSIFYHEKARLSFNDIFNVSMLSNPNLKLVKKAREELLYFADKNNKDTVYILDRPGKKTKEKDLEPNEYLVPPKIKELIYKIYHFQNEQILKSTLKTDETMFYHGSIRKDIVDAKKGDVIENGGFTHVSLVPEIAGGYTGDGGVLLRINAKEGDSVKFVYRKIFDMECMFPMGTKFTVEKTSYEQIPVTRYFYNSFVVNGLKAATTGKRTVKIIDVSVETPLTDTKKEFNKKIKNMATNEDAEHFSSDQLSKRAIYRNKADHFFQYMLIILPLVIAFVVYYISTWTLTFVISLIPEPKPEPKPEPNPQTNPTTLPVKNNETRERFIEIGIYVVFGTLALYVSYNILVLLRERYKFKQIRALKEQEDNSMVVKKKRHR